MTLYELAEELIASFPSIFSKRTEFTFDPMECSLKCLGIGGPDVEFFFCEDDICVNMEFVNNEDCMNWMDNYGSKEFKRIENFVLKTYKAHKEICETEEEVTFYVE